MSNRCRGGSGAGDWGGGGYHACAILTAVELVLVVTVVGRDGVAAGGGGDKMVFLLGIFRMKMTNNNYES